MRSSAGDHCEGHPNYAISEDLTRGTRLAPNFQELCKRALWVGCLLSSSSECGLVQRA